MSDFYINKSKRLDYHAKIKRTLAESIRQVKKNAYGNCRRDCCNCHYCGVDSETGTNTDYSTLFTGLNQEEAQEVVALLQEEGVDYRFNDKDGAIRVPAVKADQTRAELLSKGYPKSGFTYDMYRNNAGAYDNGVR